MTSIGGNEPGRVIELPRTDGASLTLAWGSATDVGRRRSANEDSSVAASPLFAVADGMGGHAAGDLASAAVVRRLSECVVGSFGTARAVEKALEAATDDIDEIAGVAQAGVGTTVTGAVLTVQDEDAYFTVFNIGDSRVYLYLDGALQQVTVDHSVVQEMVDAGALTRHEAEHHPDANVITRAVGFSVLPDIDFWALPAVTGLQLMMCSDGLTKELSDEQIAAHFAEGLSPERTAARLVHDAVEAGGRDNVTVVVVEVMMAPEPADTGDTIPRD